MAFDAKQLSLLSGANGFHHWHYRSSTDSLVTAIAAGYFSGDAPKMMGNKDTIVIEAKGSTALCQITSNGFVATAEIIQDEWVHDASKIQLATFTPQVELLAGTSRFVVSPVAGWVSRLTTIIRSTVTTTGGSLTVEIATAAVLGLSNVIPSASAALAGLVYSGIPRYSRDETAYVDALQAIELVGDGGFAGAGDVIQIIEIDPEDPSDGTIYLSHYINEVDLLAGTSQFMISPVAGQIKRMSSVTVDAVTTGGSLILEIGGTAPTGLEVVVANGGGAGDVDSDVPTSVADATGTVAAGTVLEIDVDSTFATAGSAWILVEITPTTNNDIAYVWDYIEETDLLAGTSHWVLAPITGYITRVRTVSTTDITTGGTITLELGGIAVPGLAVVVGDAGGVGDADTDTPSGPLLGIGSSTPRNSVKKGDPIEIVGDAAFAGAGTLGVQIEITPTG